jgi:hypothetical protein
MLAVLLDPVTATNGLHTWGGCCLQRRRLQLQKDRLGLLEALFR